jgi:hypothetical protein
MNAGEAAGWLLTMLAAYLSGSVQMVCNRFAGLRAHYRIEWRILGNGTRLLVTDPGSTHPSIQVLLCVLDCLCVCRLVASVCDGLVDGAW